METTKRNEGSDGEGLPAAHATTGLRRSNRSRPASTFGANLDIRIDVKGAFIVKDSDNLNNKEDQEEQEWRKEEDYQHDSSDIRLPHHQSAVSHMAIDIGGSLIKLCYWTFEGENQGEGGRLIFRKFPTDRIDACIEYMKQLAAKHRIRSGKNGDDPSVYVVATGGGAFKFYDKIREELNAEVMKEDEMECLIIGLDFFISQVANEVFMYTETPPYPIVPAETYTHPYLLVNIGSGVSMIKVSGPRQFERVGGTSLGGGTLFGLLSLLTGARSFEDMLRLAEKGDSTKVDMLVGDIYGTDYNKIGLKSTTIASTMGKIFRTKREAEREAEDHGGMNLHDHGSVDASEAGSGPSNHTSFLPEDVSRSLLYAISNNIGQLAYLHAEKHGCEHIYFGGSFIGGHWQTMATLAYAIKFWSKGTKAAYFLRHEGYLGAVGAFLNRHASGFEGKRRGSFDGLVASLSRVTSRT